MHLLGLFVGRLSLKSLTPVQVLETRAFAPVYWGSSSPQRRVELPLCNRLEDFRFSPHHQLRRLLGSAQYSGSNWCDFLYSLVVALFVLVALSDWVVVCNLGEPLDSVHGGGWSLPSALYLNYYRSNLDCQPLTYNNLC